MKIPRISGLDVVKKLKRVGFVPTRQRGDHLRLEKNTSDKTIKLTVPLHKELKTGTLVQIIKQADLTFEQFMNIK
ncbi:MAG: type II toxin-antitoxin system HicA family toxin [Candidatus Woesearchaeota archaeon]